MSRGSQIAIGVTCLICAVGFLTMAPLLANGEPQMLATFGGLSLVCSIFAAACLVRRGRRVTMRISAAICSVVCFSIAIVAISSDLKTVRKVQGVVFFSGLTVGLAYFAIKGGYPAGLPLSDLLETDPVQPPSKSPAASKPGKPGEFANRFGPDDQERFRI